jgi:chloramphenicol-sensitive protein RarD
VALGTLVLGERLRRAQWVAVALAGSGVVVLGISAWRDGVADTLWISLALATTFSLYGLIRKRVAAEALVGLEHGRLRAAAGGGAVSVVGFTAPAFGRGA